MTLLSPATTTPRCSTSAPVSLWLEDYSAVGQLFDAWRAEGVTDLASHFRDDPSRIKACSERIRVLKVNRRHAGPVRGRRSRRAGRQPRTRFSATRCSTGMPRS